MKISYSGIRGIVGESLTPEVAREFGWAFAQLVRQHHPGVERPRLVIGRDSRPSGPALTRGLLEGVGPEFELIDVGISPTPTVQFALEALQAHAAIVVTASHNPPEWNGFKFLLSPQRTVLDGQQVDQLMKWVEKYPGKPLQPGNPGDRRNEVMQLHLDRVLQQVQPEPIRAAGLKVALDAGGGAGLQPAERLLHALGCQVVVVDAERDSEPLPENLSVLCSVVPAQGCRVGLAQDLDADRLALVDETGQAIGEELTLVLCLERLLSRPYSEPPTVVRNISTTHLIDKMAKDAGATVVETRVGEVNLSKALAEQQRLGKPAFGGEGSGGVILPTVGYGRDSLVGIALTLEWLALHPGRTLAEWSASLPQMPMVKQKLPLANLEDTYARLLKAFPDAQPDRLDGLRLSWPDGSWILLRPSNTEPILRAVGQSANESWLQGTMKEMLRLAQG